MIVCDGQVRLTGKEREQLAYLTGSDPGELKSLQELEAFITRHALRQDCRGPGACLARRLLLSYLPAETIHSETARKACCG